MHKAEYSAKIWQLQVSVPHEFETHHARWCATVSQYYN